jgi:GntR family transcriptional regulator, transcriptional repressor for pyruvate dehydrogenase complex
MNNKQWLIEHRIEDGLLKGRWKLFERLPSERHLAEEFGVNRGTVRSALHALAGRGILEIKRGSGSVVSTLPKPQSGRNKPGYYIQAFRLFIPVLAESLALSSPAARLASLEQILPTAGSAIRDGDMDAFIHEQVRFLVEFVQLSQNPCLVQAAVRVLPDARLLTWLLRGTSLVDCEPLFAGMVRLVSALRYEDGNGARQAVLAYADSLEGLLGAAR